MAMLDSARPPLAPPGLFKSRIAQAAGSVSPPIVTCAFTLATLNRQSDSIQCIVFLFIFIMYDFN
jgi:hypothetical protein